MAHSYVHTGFLLLLFVMGHLAKYHIIKDNHERVAGKSVHPAYICSRIANTTGYIGYAGHYGKILCDINTDGGGWVVVLKRYNGRLSFNKKWIDFTFGFGDVTGEFWMGNYFLYMLTAAGNYHLRVDMIWKAQKYYAMFPYFKILSDKQHYRLRVAKMSVGNAGDSLSYHNNSVFSAIDKDNNLIINKYNCVNYAQAAWWYYYCQKCLLFGKWKSKRLGIGINWLTVTGYESSLDYVEMKIKFDTKWY